MKKFSIISLTFLLAIFLVTSCQKESATDDLELISYPDSGYFGKNILNTTDSIYKCDQPPFGDGNFNSMKAFLPSINSKLKIEILGIGTAIYNNQSWFTNADIYHTYNNVFEAQGIIYADLKVFFMGPGEATINIYENDDKKPTRIKHIKLIL
jgi:hypothetical protein